MDTEQINQGQG